VSGPAESPSDLVVVGAIAGAFGVRGEVRVRSFTAEPDGVVAYGPLLDASGKVVLTPKRWRPINDGLAVTAPEVTSREQAEALRNTALHVRRSVLPPTDEDEFYHVDLIGCRVEAFDGGALGEVVAVHDFGAGDLLGVRGPQGRMLYLPFTREATPIIDVTARRIVAAPPPEGEDDGDDEPDADFDGGDGGGGE
jgi:16S rRNA processing protein RimM